ncbi:terpene cyclase/mutase family protein [bacterium]|nr:terpene cyclase/mutase family protein [bacterium]
MRRLAAEAQRSGPAGPGQHAMHSHGFACLCLSEASGTLPEPARQRRVQAVLERAVGYTVQAQAADGGWRYVPHPPYSDVSVTVAQLMALRAARNAGVHVRKGVVDAGAGFVRSCQQPDGGFAYTRGPAAASAFARSAASLVGLFSAGVYAGSQLERGLRYVMQFLPVRQFSPREVPPGYYYYGHYYAALAMWTAGGEYWAHVVPGDPRRLAREGARRRRHLDRRGLRPRLRHRDEPHRAPAAEQLPPHPPGVIAGSRPLGTRRRLLVRFS